MSSTLTYSVANFISWEKKSITKYRTKTVLNSFKMLFLDSKKLIKVGNTDLSNLKNRPTSLSNFLQGSWMKKSEEHNKKRKIVVHQSRRNKISFFSCSIISRGVIVNPKSYLLWRLILQPEYLFFSYKKVGSHRICNNTS